MSDDIIEIDEYEVKDKQIIEASEDDDYQCGSDSQREYDGSGSVNGFYRSISLSNITLIIVSMVVILLLVIFIMTFD